MTALQTNSVSAASRTSAAELAPLSDETMSEVQEIYERLIKGYVHHYW